MLDWRIERGEPFGEPEEERPWRLLVALGFVERRPLMTFCCCIVTERTYAGNMMTLNQAVACISGA